MSKHHSLIYFKDSDYAKVFDTAFFYDLENIIKLQNLQKRTYSSGFVHEANYKLQKVFDIQNYMLMFTENHHRLYLYGYSNSVILNTMQKDTIMQHELFEEIELRMFVKFKTKEQSLLASTLNF